MGTIKIKWHCVNADMPLSLCISLAIARMYKHRALYNRRNYLHYLVPPILGRCFLLQRQKYFVYWYETSHSSLNVKVESFVYVTKKKFLFLDKHIRNGAQCIEGLSELYRGLWYEQLPQNSQWDILSCAHSVECLVGWMRIFIAAIETHLSIP